MERAHYKQAYLFRSSKDMLALGSGFLMWTAGLYLFTLSGAKQLYDGKWLPQDNHSSQNHSRWTSLKRFAHFVFGAGLAAGGTEAMRQGWNIKYAREKQKEA